MRHLYVCLALISVILAGCPRNSSQPSIPDTKLATELPVFAQQINEVEIADSMNDVDPSWVLGSIVNVRTGEVRGLDNYLSPNAKPLLTPQTEVFFKNLIENSVAVNAAWLEFLSGKLNDKVRAEVSVIKTSKVTMRSEDVDRQRLTTELRRIASQERADYGVIIGYIHFVLSASLFKDLGTDVSVSGYGAKIGGTWFSKFEDTSAHHRVVAIWSPLPFVADYVETTIEPRSNLETATRQAIDRRTLQIMRIDRPVEAMAYIENKKQRQ